MIRFYAAVVALPIVAVRLPAVLAGQPNGRLPDGLLHSTPGLAGGPTVLLVSPAANAWRAMTVAALRDGVVLKASGPFDSYRPYSVQERIFRQRYTTTSNGRTPRTWQGQRWYKRPGVAAAAVPGTSNHGRALAVDTGTELDGDSGTESLDRRTLDWLLAHAIDFGWSWELQSEPWHLRYWAGDVPPPAVVAYMEDDDMALNDDDKRWMEGAIRSAMIEVLAHETFDADNVDDQVAGVVRNVATLRRLVRADLTAQLVALGMSAADAAAEASRVESTPNATVALP